MPAIIPPRDAQGGTWRDGLVSTPDCNSSILTSVRKEQLANVVRDAHCRVFGWEEAANDSQRQVLAVLIGCFNDSATTVLCEPSLARNTVRPPDIVLVDPVVGVHVIEVKGVTLQQVEEIEPGGQLRIRYRTNVSDRNVIAQVRKAMFDIRDAAQGGHHDELTIPFRYWVVFPRITRDDWFNRFGPDAFAPPELLFSEDLVPSDLSRRLGVSDRSEQDGTISLLPQDQFDALWRAFGDSAVLRQDVTVRRPRLVREGTLGQRIDALAESIRMLSDEQHELSRQQWEGPRLVRGVAGSGKTVVLANHLARRLHRRLRVEDDLFDPIQSSRRTLTVCFNRTLAPFIRRKIDAAFVQRSGRHLPETALDVMSFNRLAFELSKRGFWRYQPVAGQTDDQGEASAARARQYLKELLHVKEHEPRLFEQHAYESIYVDEGQDFLEDEFRLLKELCHTQPGAEPNLFIFYDDAQNLYARPRPNWTSLGINIRGRSHVMTECFRNTRAVIEAAFNVLYGSHARDRLVVPTRAFGDVGYLREKRLIEQHDDRWLIHFAKRQGPAPIVHIAPGRRDENTCIVDRHR